MNVSLDLEKRTSHINVLCKKLVPSSMFPKICEICISRISVKPLSWCSYGDLLAQHQGF